jgi:hypothetical protein
MTSSITIIIWRFLFWFGCFFATGYRLRTIWWHVTSFLTTLNFVWLDSVDWKQLITCSFLAPFLPLCGVWLDLGLVYLRLIRIYYITILFNLFIFMEDCELAVHSCSLFGYDVLVSCRTSETTEFSRLWNVNLGWNSHMWRSSPFVCMGIDSIFLFILSLVTCWR